MKIIFEEMLKTADFYYTIGKKENEFCVFLVDEQGAYLGGQDNYNFIVDEPIGAVARIIDRIGICWEDSLYNDIVEILEADGYAVFDDYKELLYFYKNNMHSVRVLELEDLVCVIDSSRREIFSFRVEHKFA